MGSTSIWHWLLLGLVVLLLFGRGRFSEMMGDVAKGLKSFKKGLAEEEAATPPQTPAPRIEGRPAAPTLDGEPMSTPDRQA
jgi:sec-independent protein translocase protein TatA